MSRFCRFCGKELKNPNARFCPACGQRLSPAAAPEAEAPGPRLVIHVPGQSPREVTLDRPAFTIGRKPDNDVVLPVEYVSGYHGRLERIGADWRYTDLGSTNGTYVNGQRVQEATLRDGDILRIGDPQGNSVGLTFRAPVAAGAPAPPQGTILMGAAALGMKPSLIIGRNPQADIHLAAPTVSWQHARLDRTAQGHVLTDLNSTNGTFVNGQRVMRPCALKQGDVVQIGPFRLVYEATGFQQYTAAHGMRLDGVGLTREVGRGARKKRILDNVNVSIHPREFVALVGASGAGKTTLLMALNGFVRADRGQVLVNGEDLYQHFDLYRTLVGYVPQEDIIHKDLTVAGALRYAARLRLPPDTSGQEIEERIGQVLQQVGMLEQKDQVISSLSGGQRKRVNIAVELLAEPRLFFLDEPTSGLDPGLEKMMMHTLRHLADGGRTVVLVTHATANIAQCDHVCFMSQGRVVYFGPPAEALGFFGVTSGDFADIYARLDAPDPRQARQKAAWWEQRFRQSPQYRQYVADRQQVLPQIRQKAARAATQQRPRANPLQQFFVLTRRYLDLVARDRLLLTVLVAVMPIIALLLLIISKSNWLVGDSAAYIEQWLAQELASGKTSATYSIVGESQTLLFMLALAAVLLGLFAAAYEIVKERSIYLRERMVTLRLLPYLGSKVTVLGAFALLQCFLLLFVVSWKVRLPGAGVLLPAPVEMYVTLVLGALTAIMLGLFISALAPNTNTVIYIVLLALFFQIIFAGVFFKLPGAAKNLSYLTVSRWVMEGLGTSADLKGLDALTRTRFQPEPITQTVSVEVERPDPDWQPVTVVTETQYVPVAVQPGLTQTVPISVPVVKANEMVTVTEPVSKTVTVSPEATDIPIEREFQVDYTRTVGHLLRGWTLLLILSLAFGAGTIIVLKRRDVG